MNDEIKRARYQHKRKKSWTYAMGYHSYLQNHMIPFEKSGTINKIFSWKGSSDFQTKLLEPKGKHQI